MHLITQKLNFLCAKSLPFLCVLDIALFHTFYLCVKIGNLCVKVICPKESIPQIIVFKMLEFNINSRFTFVL